ncbi:uncharacterized protein ALTATR162_LOCUS11674 [Alternaria atra]|uniref:Carrier domain-containing protein n=1 Tax=Alternaria atra TaxID=119953 RepID=A0A8J2IBG2_9PLEO|nr:uncharacterized protein ALTATR162_LOCUS11674 [Alternaria atra]CAG5186694.1 unnamed protein product [Alternaria atra]
MSEWLGDTMNTIFGSNDRPLNVLEIGSGTGMILFNLTSRLQSYVGLDPSQRAVSFVRQTARSIPDLADKVHVFKGTAADINQMDRSIAPNMVVINSVAQYFPSQEYLLKVVEDLLKRDTITTLFFGDIRSFALYKEFRVTKALYVVGEEPTPDDIRQRIAEIEQNELELLVEPAFFTSLQDRFPDYVEHVEILPKIMQATNELSCYRYAAVVHTKRSSQGLQLSNVQEINHEHWQDFVATGLSEQSLLKLLQKSSESTVAISNIPNHKTVLERHIIRFLEGGKDIRTENAGHWLSVVQKQAEQSSSLSAFSLSEIAQQAGYKVEISWARQYSHHGGFDAIFHRYQLPQPGRGRIMFRFPTDHQHRSTRLWCSQPLQQQVKQEIKQQLQDQLQAQLPSYMVPQVITILEMMPVNENGKVDRRALTTNVQRRTAARPSLRQPSSEAQRQMQNIWAQVLKLDPVSIGLDDSFFQLGGDSLAAMRVVGEARRLRLKITVADIFRQPSLEAAANHEGTSTNEAVRQIPKSLLNGSVKQSFAQGRLWFVEQLYPGLTWYLMPCAMKLRGSIQLDALKIALSSLERRHETLRTTFSSQDGVGVQTVHSFNPTELRVVDIEDETALAHALNRDQTTPFDLTSESGWRVSVYRLLNERKTFVLSMVMHHIISDGWSVDVLQKELANFYVIALRKQDPLSQIEPLPIQYRDYSYWIEQLETSQPAEFLCDKLRPPTLSGDASISELQIEGSLLDQLKNFCKAHSVTPFTVLLAAFRSAHFRLTGATDANIGTVNANRDRWEVKDMIGFFVNLQCIRMKIEQESFRELALQTQKTVVSSFANQDVPFEDIVSTLQRDRDLSRNPLAQVIFALHSQQDLGQFTLEDVDVEPILAPSTTRFDMEFHVFQEDASLGCSVMFSTDLYESATISNMLTVFHRVLDQGLRQPDMEIASLPLLTNENYTKLVDMGLVDIVSTEYPRETSIIDLFHQQVSRCPEKTAVKDASRKITYAELDQDSDILANWLRKRYSFAPETLIGVYSNRSCQTVTAFLGILKANMAYLPFDTKTPRARMEGILSTLPGNKLVLLGSETQPPAIDLKDVELVPIAEAFNCRVNLTPHHLNATGAPSPTSLAYVMFTSGSTGKPKGVMIEHRGIVRLVKQSNMAQHLPSPVTMAHLTNVAFDVSAWEIYGAILNGGTLVCNDTMTVLDSRALSNIFEQEHIRTAIFTPAILKYCIDESPSTVAVLDALYVAGDRADSRDLFVARRLMEGKAVTNAYGPTENSVISTIYSLCEGENCTNGVPIGRAISNSGAYVMDKHQRLAPLGVIGELVVTGDGLARGYTDPERNVDRFVNVKIQDRPVRAYRTGDYVRYRPIDGQIEFFGRIDGQIKIRGHRVELGEIEHALRSHNAISDAVTVLQHEEGCEPQLIGFVTVREISELTENEDEDNANEHVEVWEELFDADTIDIGDMNEWLDETIDTILNGQEPGNVLEIGTGTGMILFNLLKSDMTDGLVKYTGLEPSGRAVDFVVKTVQSTPAFSDKVEVYKGTAADVTGLEDVSPNLVIINSVAQYFPSQEYLFKLIQDLLQLPGVQTLFFGDMRSFAMHKQFLASLALRKAETASREEIRRMMTEMARTELELLVDPGFFTALSSRLSHIVDHVEILPKRVKATNELSSYRYAAAIHAKREDQDRSQQRHETYDVGLHEWSDFMKLGLNRDSLLQHLRTPSESPVKAISNIPYSKTILERHVIEALDSGSDRHDWISVARHAAGKCSSMSALDLQELAQEADYRVEIS